MVSSNSLVQRFLWKNRIFEALFQQDDDIVQMRYMAHSICLINSIKIIMRKGFDFSFLTTSNAKMFQLSCAKLFGAVEETASSGDSTPHTT